MAVVRNIAALAHGLGRHPLVTVNFILILILGCSWTLVGQSVRQRSSTDTCRPFHALRSSGSGGLGGRQLCPTLQQQLPREVFEQQASTQGALQARQGLTLRIEHVGDKSRRTGGEIRFYIATNRDACRDSGQKMIQ
jgi:hypothetical protein